jgi:hypothetical protein
MAARRMTNLLDQFPIGTEVEFEYDAARKLVRWNHGQEYGKGPYTWVRGSVTQHMGLDILVEFHHSVSGYRDTWWFCIEEKLLAQEGYVRLLHKTSAKKSLKGDCQCDSFTLTWIGHNPERPCCPKDKKRYL